MSSVYLRIFGAPQARGQEGGEPEGPPPETVSGIAASRDATGSCRPRALPPARRESPVPSRAWFCTPLPMAWGWCYGWFSEDQPIAGIIPTADVGPPAA